MKPTPEQIGKLPKWAQDYINTLERERMVAVRELNKWIDDQTPSSFSISELLCVGEKSEKNGPSFKTRYVQGHRLSINHAGVHAEIMLAGKDDSQRDFGIEISYSVPEGRVASHVALIPKGFQQFQLVAKENMH